MIILQDTIQSIKKLGFRPVDKCAGAFMKDDGRVFYLNIHEQSLTLRRFDRGVGAIVWEVKLTGCIPGKQIVKTIKSNLK